MTSQTVIAIVVVVALIVAGIAVWSYLRKRSRKLRQRFGPEYDRTIREVGGRRRAEELLEKREKRVNRLQLRALRPSDQARYTERWRQVQADFVDNPKLAFAEADVLVGELMKARGYPLADFEQRAADISVDHALVVDNYRTAHAIALRHQRGQASTEDLRQAMVQYRTLFDDLLGVREMTTTEVRR